MNSPLAGVSRTFAAAYCDVVVPASRPLVFSPPSSLRRRETLAAFLLLEGFGVLSERSALALTLMEKSSDQWPEVFSSLKHRLAEMGDHLAFAESWEEKKKPYSGPENRPVDWSARMNTNRSPATQNWGMRLTAPRNTRSPVFSIERVSEYHRPLPTRMK
jgi:hypothetical protein